MWLSTDQVVKKSWRDAKAGKVICIPGFQYLILSTIARIAPRPMVRKAGINVRRKQRVE
jgi:short-subunit dehydrogenase